MAKESLEENRSRPVVRKDAEVSETELVEAARRGDKAAFGRLIRRHQKRLFRFVIGLTGSFDQAEDVVQESFVKAYGAIGTFKEGHRFYPWIATIARNLALNLIVRDRKTESLDKIEQSGFDPPSPQLGPLDSLLDTEGQKRFYKALGELPAAFRTVFVLRHFEEMDYEQIARQLGIPTGTVDSRLYRARKILMEALKDLL